MAGWPSCGCPLRRLSTAWNDDMDIAGGKRNLAQKAEQPGDQREHGQDEQCSDDGRQFQTGDRADEERCDHDADQKRATGA